MRPVGVMVTARQAALLWAIATLYAIGVAVLT
jgi:hypothetical protein